MKKSLQEMDKCRQSSSKYSPESIFSKMRNRPKFVVFIRDVPHFGHVPLALRLLNELAKFDLRPVYYYSVLELMKDKKNVNTMRGSTVTVKGLAKGCHRMIKCLFERAVTRNGSNPDIVVVDYCSEALVDVDKLEEYAKKMDFKTFLLKKRWSPDSVMDAEVKTIVNFITSSIKYQNHAEIMFQRDADKYWHELGKIYIPNDKESPAQKLEKYHLSQYLWKATPPAVKAICLSRRPSQEFLVNFKEQAELYCNKLEILAKILDGDLPMECNNNNNASNSDTIHGPDHTLIVIDDYHFRRPGHPRLFEVFMEGFMKENLPFHVIPIADLVIMPKFQQIFSWFYLRSDMDMLDTFSYLFIDAFNMMYTQAGSPEKIVILDNIHEGIVFSSYHIQRALDKKWEVLVLKRNQSWPSNDCEIVQQTMGILRRKYFTRNVMSSGDAFSFSVINAFGDLGSSS